MPGPVLGVGDRRVSKTEKAFATVELTFDGREQASKYLLYRRYRVKEGSILDWVVREGFPEEVTFNQSLK